MWRVSKVSYNTVKPWLLEKHYAQRIPSISYRYGLFKGDELKGVCTIGKPASPSLCKGICGEEYRDRVYELNRLVVEDGLPKNTLSWFVGQVLRELKEEDLILVSYADEGMGHHGYIYQATNWIYTGKTRQRTDKYTPSGKHSRHYDNKYNHLRKVRSSKHRYVYFTGKSRKKFLKLLNYPIIKEYPKGKNKRYKFGDRKPDIIYNKKTGKYFTE